jgi:hypothetical protein
LIGVGHSTTTRKDAVRSRIMLLLIIILIQDMKESLRWQVADGAVSPTALPPFGEYPSPVGFRPSDSATQPGGRRVCQVRRKTRWLSELKWLCSEAWTEANF